MGDPLLVELVYLYIWINSTVLVMGRDLFIFAMLSPAEIKRPSKDPALTGSVPEEDDDDDDLI
jgi:hypothetical protein